MCEALRLTDIPGWPFDIEGEWTPEQLAFVRKWQQIDFQRTQRAQERRLEQLCAETPQAFLAGRVRLEYGMCA